MMLIISHYLSSSTPQTKMISLHQDYQAGRESCHK